jgi:uncharacterized membrane protein
MTDIGNFSAEAINERGDIAGTAANRPVLWRAGQLTTLPMPAGAEFGGTSDINERGQVLEYWYDGTWFHGALVDGATVTDLGLPAGQHEFDPLDLNDRGEVAGVLLGNVAVIWRAGRFLALPQPDPSFTARAVGLDNRGHVVGSAWTGPDAQHAVMWSVPATA